MNQNNILKNKTKIEKLKKTYIKKKTCKTHNLNHETRINSYKKLEDITKPILKKKLMQNDKIVSNRIPNKLNIKR